jgi:isopenicillin-N N-acyltransferase like protein
VSQEAIHAALRDESDGFLSICRRPDPSLSPERCNETVAAVCVDATALRMWVAPGLPSETDFVEVDTGFASPS